MKHSVIINRLGKTCDIHKLNKILKDLKVIADELRVFKFKYFP